jgi:hypothetical protein
VAKLQHEHASILATVQAHPKMSELNQMPELRSTLLMVGKATVNCAVETQPESSFANKSVSNLPTKLCCPTYLVLRNCDVDWKRRGDISPPVTFLCSSLVT